jgi:hypothetical protein
MPRSFRTSSGQYSSCRLIGYSYPSSHLSCRNFYTAKNTLQKETGSSILFVISLMLTDSTIGDLDPNGRILTFKLDLDSTRKRLAYFNCSVYN